MKAPILFSGDMVKAILEGKKTQTRRVIRNPGRLDGLMLEGEAAEWCPYGQTGDLLWVRETWQPCECDLPECPGAIYRADGEPAIFPGKWWRPSIYMPRWASRLTLCITDVRVQRLQEITDEEAIAEGVTVIGRPELNELSQGKFVHAFANLWDSINAKRAPWNSNPWVWAISFEKARQMEAV